MILDVNASTIVTVIGALLVIIGGIGVLVWLRTTQDDTTPTDNENVIDEATDTLDETENYMRRVERLSRKEIDKRNDSDRKR